MELSFIILPASTIAPKAGTAAAKSVPTLTAPLNPALVAFATELAATPTAFEIGSSADLTITLEISPAFLMASSSSSLTSGSFRASLNV